MARGALRIVAAGGAGLATEQVVRVLLETARAGMAREADALAALLSAPGVRKAPQVGLYCAACGIVCVVPYACSVVNVGRVNHF